MKKLKKKTTKITMEYTPIEEPTKGDPTPDSQESSEVPRETISVKKTSFNELVKRAQEIADDCYDEVISPSAFRDTMYTVSGGKMRMVNDEMLKQNTMTDYALGQLCNKLGVPSAYMQKCLNAGDSIYSPDAVADTYRDEQNVFNALAVNNLSTWTKQYKGSSVLVRNYQDKVRGVLSNRYSICDTPTILDALGDILPDDYKIKGYYLSPERFHLRLVGDKLDVPNEDLFSGVQIDSSDVGRSTLIVHYMIFKQVCTNGLVVSRGSGVLFKQKHLSIDPRVFENELLVALNNIPELDNWATVVIKDSMTKDEVDFDKLKDLTELIDRVKSLTNFDEKTCKETLELMKTKYTHNRWGMINAITEMAQNYTLERRLDLEKVAGGLLIA